MKGRERRSFALSNTDKSLKSRWPLYLPVRTKDSLDGYEAPELSVAMHQDGKMSTLHNNGRSSAARTLQQLAAGSRVVHM